MMLNIIYNSGRSKKTDLNSKKIDRYWRHDGLLVFDEDRQNTCLMKTGDMYFY